MLGKQTPQSGEQSKSSDKTRPTVSVTHAGLLRSLEESSVASYDNGDADDSDDPPANDHTIPLCDAKASIDDYWGDQDFY